MFLWFNSNNKFKSNGKVIVIVIVWEVIVIIIGFLNFSSNSNIALFKMFSQWFFTNNETNITSTSLKLCSPTEDVMS